MWLMSNLIAVDKLSCAAFHGLPGTGIASRGKVIRIYHAHASYYSSKKVHVE